jgi:hypothetical protein
MLERVSAEIAEIGRDIRKMIIASTKLSFFIVYTL